MNPTVSDSSTLRFDGSSTAANRRIERGKHLRRRQYVGLGQRIEQRRFAGVGVADQRHRRDRHRLAPLPLLRANAAHVLDLLFDVPDAPVDLPAIGLELRFTRTARADAAAQLRHLNAPSGQPRQHVFQLRQLHLQLAFTGLGMAGKNVEDELRAVNHALVQDAFDVALLRWR